MTSQSTRGPGHRRRARKRVVLAASAVATTLLAGGAVALATSASAAPLGAVYSRTSTWSGGYTGQYLVTNPESTPTEGWSLSFDLPAGARLSSLWNAEYTTDGRHVTVRPAAWDRRIGPGRSVVVGFVVQGSGAAQAEPAHCLVDDSPCAPGTGPVPAPSGRPTGPAPSPTATAVVPTPTPAPGTASPTPTGATPPAPTATPTTAPPPAAGGAAFAPYVDTSLYPPFDLLATARAGGAKNVNLAFVVAGGGCAPTWGGSGDLTSNPVAAQIGALRQAGGDVRVSFGGANGSELATVCTSEDQLAAAYQRVVDTYGLTKVDFDVEGGALGDTAADTRRARAVARLQHAAAAKGRPLDVSFTLPVLPGGLTQGGVDLLADARRNGVTVGAVNIMTMDFGDGAAPDPKGRMATYAIDAATATQAQVKSVLGLDDRTAWSRIAVTPMIGVNDDPSEVFTVADAGRLAAFAGTRHLAWLSMWSATRDTPCPGGPRTSADATCSSVAQQPLDFSRALGAYTG